MQKHDYWIIISKPIKLLGMGTVNASEKGKIFPDSPYSNSQDRHKIGILISYICKSYGNDIVDYANEYIHPKIQGKEMSLEDFTKMLSGDEHLKLLLASITQRTLKKIHFWIFLWSVFTIISAITFAIYYLMFVSTN